MLSRFFIDRPIFAGVISILITLAGLVFVWQLPIAQYPEITPPTVQVSCLYPGASATVVSETLAAPIEQQILGVENMLYMSTQCTNDGGCSISVTFEVGTDLDMAQVLVQNRVNLATPSLPSEVKQTGVSVKKRSPSILLVVNLISPDDTRSQLYLSNYASIQLRNELVRVPGVGDISFLGQLDYSMRVWLDPSRMAALGITASDVMRSLREQNIQVAAGSLGREPMLPGQDFQYTLSTKGRLIEPSEFGAIVVGASLSGTPVYLKDIVTESRLGSDSRSYGGIELGAKNQDTSCTLDGKPSIGMAIYQQPGSNAIDTARMIQEKMDALKASFPPGVDYKIVYDTTPFISESIMEVFKALRDAIVLVAIVVLAFLQSWRATVIPLIAVPVAIIGTFAVMHGIGYSLNNLSLFGLVLAIGIVVDDAIVVVEAVEHHLEHGMQPRQAAIKAMEEVSGPIIAISLVLMCVFIPCIFISGITGQFFRQFAVTIAVSTFFSAVNSLTLSPALCAVLLKPKAEQNDPLSKLMKFALGWFFGLFNRFFSWSSNLYAGTVGRLLTGRAVVMALYMGLLYWTYFSMTHTPAGFIPAQDKGYLLVDLRLPDSASIERTGRTLSQFEKIVKDIPGVEHTIGVTGQSFVQNAVGSNFGSMFIILEPFHDRKSSETKVQSIGGRIREMSSQEIDEGVFSVFGPPPVDGIGSAGGFKLMLRDSGNLGYETLQSVADDVSAQSSQTPGILGMFNGFRSNTPQMVVDIDREKVKTLGIPLQEVFTTLQVQLGGAYANDFNQFGRTWQVNVQADPQYRRTPEQVGQFRVRTPLRQMVPLATFATVRESLGPSMITRYNGDVAAAINGITAPGLSSGDMVRSVQGVLDEKLPDGIKSEWTELTYLQLKAGNTALLVFAMAVVLVFLVLAAQYESLILPLSVILVVPMCLLCSVLGIASVGLDINIFVQIGFVVLVGLASKNAILIVEFAKQLQESGKTPREATIEACRMRLRPILMTSFAFILGVVPLVLAQGAGAEMRKTLGIAVFTGMLGVTFFGIFLTPVFYFLVAGVVKKKNSSL
ncbi:MAG: multidrug efflux RND transporter permease subunit [Planctomycetota bacterium]|nr:multidrug efflux RND transporter permease subunit [Planctomycetota bacterium]